MALKFGSILQYTRENVATFYKDYCARLDRVIELENEQKSKADNLDIWIEKYHLKSKEIFGLYEENEKQLKKYIYPFLDGTKKMNQRLANIYLDQIIKMYDDYYDDSLVMLEILKYIIHQYEEHPKKDVSRYVIALCIAGALEDGLGVEEHFKKAIEYNTKAIAYADQYAKLSPRAKRCMFCSFHNRLVSEIYRKSCNIEDLYRYLREARLFYGDLENRKFEVLNYENFLQISNSMANFEVLSVSKKKICCLTGFSNEAAENAEMMYNIVLRRLSKKDEVAPLVYINYLLAQYYKKNMSARETFECMFEAYKKADRNINFDRMDFLSSPIYEYTLFSAPEMLVLIRQADYEEVKVIELSRQIVEDVFRLYADIPYHKRNNQTKNMMYAAYQYILPYYHVDVSHLEVLMKATISRENSTAIHTNMVVNLATELVKSVIRFKPELIVGLNGYKNISEVREHESDIISYVKEAAFCHDIGKIAVASIINIQYRKIIDVEYDVIRDHATIGAEILENVPELSEYANISKGHHADYNGVGGYPDSYQRENDKNAFWVDLIKICDCADAATDYSGRVYKSTITYDDFLEELKEGRAKQYNPDLVDLFFEDPLLSKTIRYLTTEGRDTMLYGIYRLLQ